jgi:pSer/pThr/pTyr-binding forkhead associated (FHA) protein
MAHHVTVPVEDDSLFVDERLPQKGKKKKKKNGSRKNGVRPQGARSSASPKSKPKRAAERRRARGEAPAGPDDGTNTALQQPGGESGKLAYAAGVLTCVKGPEEGLALNLLDGSYTIGRGRDNSFVLKDIAASRTHVRVEVSAAGIRVKDLGSGNGTRLNGETISEAMLDNGDRLEVGNSVLVFTKIDNASSLDGSGGAGAPASERIARAAEKLAAELSERLREEDDFEDMGPTASERQTKHQPALASSDAGKPPMPSDLWNDAETHVPLSDVVPADQRLGPSKANAIPSPSKLVSQSDMSPQPSRPSTKSRSKPKPAPRRDPSGPLPPYEPPEPPSRVRAQPPPSPPPPQRERAAADISVPGPQAYGVSARGEGAPILAYFLLSALVMVLLGGTVFGVYWFVIREGKIGATDEAYEQALKAAYAAALDERWVEAHELAGKAFEYNANSDEARQLLSKARAHLPAKGAPAPTAPGEATPDQPAPGETPPGQTPPTQATPGGEGDAPPTQATPEQTPPGDATAPPAETPPDAPPASDPAIAAAGAATTSPEPTPAADPPPPTPPPAEAKPPPPPAEPKPAPVVKSSPPKEKAPRARRKPRRKPTPKPKGMTDAEAKASYSKAVRLVRDDDPRGCKLIKKVASKAPSDSPWKAKAKHAVAKYGCD